MKLLLYSHTFAPNIGGIETITLSLARGLATSNAYAGKHKTQVTVVTETPAGGCDDSRFPFTLVRRPGLFALAKLIRTADVIHLAGPALIPMCLAKIFGKPYVIEHHGYQAICPNGILLELPAATICPGHFQAGRYRKCIKCESQHITWSRAVLKVLQNLARLSRSKRAASNIAISRYAANRLALPNTVVIYHGLESDSRNASEPRATLSSSTKIRFVRFGYVGRFVPEKGIPILLDAAHRLRSQRQDFEVVLVGDGPQRSQIEKQIQSSHAGEYVRITGFLSGEKLAAELNALDVVVMPSIWEETAGLAAIEQMLRARLVIASDTGGLGEMVGDAALKFPPGDAQRLADQMKKALDDPAIVSTTGQAAQARARSLFSESRMIADHAAAYRKLA